jgi:hypothetical protein
LSGVKSDRNLLGAGAESSIGAREDWALEDEEEEDEEDMSKRETCRNLL